MNKQELIDYCNVLKESKGRFINCIDVDRIIDTIKQLDEPEKVKVPQFVAEIIEYYKGQNATLYDALREKNFNKQYNEWLMNEQDAYNKVARAWLDGYEIEEEKKFKITLLNRNDGHLYLVNQNAGLADEYGHFSPVVLLFTKSTNFSEKSYKLTKKEVIANGFGWVFNCEGVEIEEVEE
nr:MAG TPA: Protein of unknown function (DUF1642) [Caudoviricetes sp.]